MSEARGGPVRLVLTLVGFGAAAMAARALLGAPLVVGSGAMAPALAEGEVVWVDRAGGDAATPGAVVAFQQPGDGALTVKRVVAGAGQRVELSRGGLRIDGLPHGGGGEEPWCGAPVAVRGAVDSPETPVPAGAVYVLGDDRRASSDSRQWGPIPLDNVAGRVRFVVWGVGGPRLSVGCNEGAAPTD
jgi:signal peptidase I